MPGVGKSTIGKKLAKAINYKFYDLDKLIVANEGQSIEAVFNAKGESYFRTIETKLLHETISLDKAVIACGGGTPAFNNNMDWLNKNGLTVYLQASLSFILYRIVNGEQARPLLKADDFESLKEKLQKLFLQREPFYALAAITCEFPLESFQDVVNKVVNSN